VKMTIAFTDAKQEKISHIQVHESRLWIWRGGY
jgi:hypothetical protein